MTNQMKSLISGSNYLVDYEARSYIVFDPKKSPEEIYEQLCEKYELLQPYELDVEDFEEWVNHEYSAMDILNGELSDLREAKIEYRNEIIDPAIYDFFTDPKYFAWL